MTPVPTSRAMLAVLFGAATRGSLPTDGSLCVDVLIDNDHVAGRHEPIQAPMLYVDFDIIPLLADGLLTIGEDRRARITEAGLAFIAEERARNAWFDQLCEDALDR